MTPPIFIPASGAERPHHRQRNNGPAIPIDSDEISEYAPELYSETEFEQPVESVSDADHQQYNAADVPRYHFSPFPTDALGQIFGYNGNLIHNLVAGDSQDELQGGGGEEEEEDSGEEEDEGDEGDEGDEVEEADDGEDMPARTRSRTQRIASGLTSPQHGASEFVPIDLESSESEGLGEEGRRSACTPGDGLAAATTITAGSPSGGGSSRRMNGDGSRARRGLSSGESPRGKRQRVSANGEHINRATDSQQQQQQQRTIEEIDLVEDEMASTLQKQREEQVRAQQEQEENKDSVDGVPTAATSKLKSFQCTICLDTPTDLTATACGHMFCRTCLLDWLSAGERELGRRANCPACRKPLNRTKKADIVALEFMKRLPPAPAGAPAAAAAPTPTPASVDA